MNTVVLIALLVTQPAEPSVLTLEEALAQAQDRNLDLKAAQARLEQAQVLSSKAWAGYLPQLSLGASYTRNNTDATIPFPTSNWVREMGPDFAESGANGPADPSPTFDPTQPVSETNVPGTASNLAVLQSNFVDITIQELNQLDAQAQVSQALIVPQLWAGIRNAYRAEEVAELNVENARREILFAVAQMYYGTVGLKQAIEVQERLLESNRAHERDAQTRLAAGALPRISLIRAQIDRAQAEQDLLRAQNAFASAKIGLATMLQRDTDFDVAPPPEPKVEADDSESLLDAALVQRPDVRAAQASAELAGGQKTAVYSKYLPSVVANAVWRVSNIGGFTGENDSWSVTVAASWNIFDGGLREADLREAEAKVVEARALALAAELRAKEDVKRALLDLESARANRTKAQERLSLARENMRLVDVNYRSGVSTQLDVTDATTALTSAELGAVAEGLNAQLAALRLLKAAGAFNP